MFLYSSKEGELMNLPTYVDRLDDGRLKFHFALSPFSAPVKIFSHNSPQKIFREGNYLTTLSRQSYVIVRDPSPGQRLYFRFQSSRKRFFISAERRLYLQGPQNLRDLGGYMTTDGRMVRWGCLYRSDQLAQLTKQDKIYLKKLGLKMIYDLRTSLEYRKYPTPDLDGIFYQRRSVLPEKNPLDILKILIKMKQGIKYMTLKENYLYIIHDKKSQQVYRDLLELAIESCRRPLLFHCTSGKDRTGLGAAFVLYALGIPENTILNDYMLSLHYLKERNKELIDLIKEEWSNYPDIYRIVEDLFSLKEEYLLDSFATIKHFYGSIDNYLEHELGLTDDKRSLLQKKLLISS